jgi:polyisoprenoid-binding protein YceI
MLGASQLDAAHFPEVKAELVSLQRKESSGKDGPWNTKLRVTIHGKTVERTLPVTWSESSGAVKAELIGAFKFSEFGIEPYSAMLGAIRNDDLFHIYASVGARRH